MSHLAQQGLLSLSCSFSGHALAAAVCHLPQPAAGLGLDPIALRMISGAVKV